MVYSEHTGIQKTIREVKTMLVLYWDFWWIMDMITEKLSKIFRFC